MKIHPTEKRCSYCGDYCETVGHMKSHLNKDIDCIIDGNYSERKTHEQKHKEISAAKKSRPIERSRSKAESLQCKKKVILETQAKESLERMTQSQRTDKPKEK